VPENPSREDDDKEETSQVESVAPENRADEVDPLPTTRSGRTYKPYDWAKHFPETAHTQYREGAEGTWSRPYYIDATNNMIKRLMNFNNLVVVLLDGRVYLFCCEFTNSKKIN